MATHPSARPSARPGRKASRPKPSAHAGGCLCGAVRFEAEGKPLHVGHCHCSMCRRASGAPVVTFAGFPTAKVAFTKGKAKVYRSSKIGRRGFCAKCGSQLYFQYAAKPERMGINVGCLDAPERVKPERHIYVETAIAWLHMRDGLPRQRGE